jgi:glycosyltransferase involved in cell wall biosynthesis
MRILKVTQAYYPFFDRGGPAIKVRAIARALVAQGHQITVLTADLGFKPKDLALARAVQDGRGWRSELDGVEAIYLGTQCHYRNLTVNASVMGFCRESLRDFDLVHIYGLYDALGPVVAWYCRQYGIPYLVEPLGMTRPIDRGFVVKKLWNRLANGYLNRADRMIATSELEKAELLTEGFSADQVLLRYNGVDLEEFRQLPSRGTFLKKAGLRDDERIVVFLGRLIPRKGADLLIEAISQIGDHKARLIIAGPEGEAGYLASLRVKARVLGVEQRVLFTGPLYDDDKKAALVDAWVLALPSRYENFGNAAAEAIACGTPAIVSDQCGIAPLLNQRAGLVTSYDSEAVARTLEDLVKDANLYLRLKAGCPQVANEISWDRLVQEMQHSYEQVTDQRPRQSSFDSVWRRPRRRLPSHEIHRSAPER